MKGGTENSNYSNVEVKFMGIPNIHEV